MQRKSLTEKVHCLGIDGMDPRLTKKYVNMGLMPNVAHLIKAGSAREDLVMFGALPTVTPPQWTTMATGAYPQTHGVTGFFRQGSGNLDHVNINFDSRNCWAEQLWNVTTEAGMKTLVWHWPGSSWPPSSDSPLLHVVDGTGPGSANMQDGYVDAEYLMIAGKDIHHATYRSNAGVGVSVDDKVAANDEDQPILKPSNMAVMSTLRIENGWPRLVLHSDVDGQGAYLDRPIDAALSPITDADDAWAAAPEGAKEFTMSYAYGAITRPALILRNAEGIYDKVAIYKDKADTEPMVVLAYDVYTRNIVEDAIRNDAVVKTTRDMRVLELSEDGTFMKMWVSGSMDCAANNFWHPKALFDEVVNTVGYPPSTSMLGGDKVIIGKCLHGTWEHVADWQSGALTHLMKNGDYRAVFSHYHAPDLQKHTFVSEMKNGTRMTQEEYEQLMQNIYTQIDRYVSHFIPFLDDGWTILLMSDHAQLCPTYGIRDMGETSCNIGLMEELGFTVRATNEDGRKLRKIDWSKTKAVANREMYIYINLKGRDPKGIVEPEDQYQVEEEIMTALYGYKDKVTGQRVISFALRRKDATLIGLGAPYPQGGDIVYCMAEGYEHDHADSLSTSIGECDTSVSPIFVAAGQGIKEGFVTDRVIRQVDFAPTVAALLGVRYPAKCEGAAVYQILTEEI